MTNQISILHNVSAQTGGSKSHLTHLLQRRLPCALTIPNSCISTNIVHLFKDSTDQGQIVVEVSQPDERFLLATTWFLKWKHQADITRIMGL